MQRLQKSLQPLFHPHIPPSLPLLLHLSSYLSHSCAAALLSSSPVCASIFHHLPSPSTHPVDPLFSFLFPFSSSFQQPPLLLCASIFPSEFFSLFSLSSAFTSSPLLLQCHLQHRSRHKCPQNLPPKLNSGETCGGGLCV